MSFFKKNRGIEIPDWASFFEGDEYLFFIATIKKYFKNYEFEITDGVVKVNSDSFGNNNLGLTNLAQGCKQAKKRQYKRIVNDHFNSMIRAQKFENEFKIIAEDFEKVKDYIGVRLYDNDYVSHIGKALTIGYDFAGDIYAMIVFDFPDTVLNIQPYQIKPWNKTIHELFEIGLENIKQKYPQTITKEKINEFEIWYITSDHFFTSNIVFEIDKRKDFIGSKGAIVALPNRHNSFVYPINSLEVVEVINTIIPMVFKMYDDGPGALSKNLFWYFDKKFIEMPFMLKDGKIDFTPPQEFIEVLNSLRE